MYRIFDGYSIARAPQLQAKAEAEAHAGQLDGDSSPERVGRPVTPRPNDNCDWRGDPPEPELDDLVHSNQRQVSRSGDACDWHGDPPEPDEDELGRACKPDIQGRRPGHGEPREGARKSPIRLPSIPQDAPIYEESHPPVNDDPVEDKSKAEPGKNSRKNETPVGDTAGPSKDPPNVLDTRHSPWLGVLDEKPEPRRDKVNKGIQQHLSGIFGTLTASPSPSLRRQSRWKPDTQGPTVAREEGKPASGLAPENTAAPPLDLYTGIPVGTTTDQPVNEGRPETARAKERRRRRAERRASREARREARKKKREEKKETRRQRKERRRKEKEWKKTEKKGGELPLSIVQGLRVPSDTKIPYDSRCDICSRSTIALTNSSKWYPKCTLCGKAAQREATNNYMKSSKIFMGDVAGVDDLVDIIKKSQTKRTRRSLSFAMGYQGQMDDDLARHIALHLQDYASNGGVASLRGHTCNSDGQPGHLARQGLDGNRDSPSYENQVVPSLPGTPVSPEADWWVRALASSEPPVTPSCPSPRLPEITPLQRSKSTVYEPRPFRASKPNRLEASPSVYHFYLPFAVCHSYPCTPGHPPADNERWPATPVQPVPSMSSAPHRSVPPRVQSHLFGPAMGGLTPGQAETIASDTPRQSQDGFFPWRRESL
ncbi:hypothetical protein GGS20DRAFT_584783 [Poronia punctata]|nr:hypothetical protein GGS20DRAFT_584783 [Poronia punctata]